MSDSDDDLLALADIGGSSPQEEPISDQLAEPANPYPLEGKYRDTEDRARLDQLPEIEREEILYDRAQEMQRFEERQYLAQRRRQMARAAPSEAPSAKRQRGTTGVSDSTQSSLAKLKQRREQAQTKRTKGAVSDDEYSDSENESDGEEEASDFSDSDDGGRRRGSKSSRKSKSSRGRRSQWESESEDEEEDELSQPISLKDVNNIRWGKALFAKFSQYPGFHDAVPGCFVRVSVGANRQGRPVYRLCQVRRVVEHKPYKVGERVVDEAVVASMADSERTIRFDTCSDSPVDQEEFDFWKTRMDEAGLSLPTVRRARGIYEEVRALSKKVLTSAEIDALVERRSKLNGARGANAVLQKAELLHQREIAIDEGNNKLIEEIDQKLNLSGPSSSGSSGAGTNNTAPSSAGSAKDPQSSSQPTPPPSAGSSKKDVLFQVNERNRKANVESVRKAEIQLHNERRKAGANAKSDPFSRLRTTARTFYRSEDQPTLDSSNRVQQTLEEVDQSVPLAALDDMIADLDIPITIEI